MPVLTMVARAFLVCCVYVPRRFSAGRPEARAWVTCALVTSYCAWPMRISSLSRRTRAKASATDKRTVSARCADTAEGDKTKTAATNRRLEIIELTTGLRRDSLGCRGAVSYRGLGG